MSIYTYKFFYMYYIMCIKVFICITGANYWCSSKECLMASIVRTITPDYQNTNIKKNFIKIVPTNCFPVRLIRGQS